MAHASITPIRLETNTLAGIASLTVIAAAIAAVPESAALDSPGVPESAAPIQLCTAAEQSSGEESYDDDFEEDDTAGDIAGKEGGIQQLLENYNSLQVARQQDLGRTQQRMMELEVYIYICIHI